MTPCRIRIDDRFLSLNGHPGTDVLCAMVTSLVVSLVRYLCDRCDCDVAYKLSDGLFILDKDTVRGDYNAMACIDMIQDAILTMSENYPNNFVVEPVSPAD